MLGRIGVYLGVLWLFGCWQPVLSQTSAERWADSALRRLSKREKLAQLLLLDATQLESSSRRLRRYGLGGLLHASRAHFDGLPAWQVDSLRIFGSQSSPSCAEERLLFSIRDTLLLQQQGRWRAAAYLEAGTHLLYTGIQPCVQTPAQQYAFSHYTKGLQAAGLYVLAGELPSVEELQLDAALPLARTDDYEASFLMLRKGKGRDFSRRALRAACRRLLLQKYRYVVAENRWPTPPAPVWQRHQRLQAALTLLRNTHQLLPLQSLDTLQLASLAITSTANAPFFPLRLRDYFEMPQYFSGPYREVPTISELTPYTHLIVSLHLGQGSVMSLSSAQRALIDSLQRQSNVIWVYFGRAEGLSELPGLAYSSALLLAHESSKQAEDLAAQAIFGGIGLQGRLPLRVRPFAAGEGLRSPPNGSLSFVPPEALDIDAKALHDKVSDIVKEGLSAAAFPGCQLLLAKDGRVFFQQSYGYHTYQQKEPVTRESIYDLASLTKVMAPTTALMRLYGEAKFSPKARLSDYLPEWRYTNKGHLDFRSLLAHHAGLQDWIAYYKVALTENGERKPEFFAQKASWQYPTPVAGNLYLRRGFKKLIYKQIAESEIGERGYKYSGLVFYLLPELIERLSGRGYVDYLRTNFYAPLGAKTLVFRPRESFPLWRLVPTEEEHFLRMQLLRGFVHDEGSAMMGGISGNSGLFGKAVDVAKLWQMYIQGGYYGGRRYLQPESLADFMACQFCDEDNHRGLGFNRPKLVYEEGNSSAAPQASEQSVGHTGYTGTMAWADARYGLLFVFLSNRVHPTRVNREIYLRNIRPRIHQAVYEALCVPVSGEE